MAFASAIGGAYVGGGSEAPFSPIVTFVPFIKPSQIVEVSEYARNGQFGIQIGCINSPEHIGADGSTLDYFHLFMYLMADGYDPLKPIRSDTARRHVGERLASIIYEAARKDASIDKDNAARVIRAKRGKRATKPNLRKLHNAGKIYGRVHRYAMELRDFVRDYIYGSMSVPTFRDVEGGVGKAPLAKETVEKRESMQTSMPWLYKGADGIYEPLYETGTLCNAIRWRVFRCGDMAGEQRRNRSRVAIEREAFKSAAREKAKSAAREKAKPAVAEKKEEPKPSATKAARSIEELQEEFFYGDDWGRYVAYRMTLAKKRAYRYDKNLGLVDEGSLTEEREALAKKGETTYMKIAFRARITKSMLDEFFASERAALEGMEK